MARNGDTEVSLLRRHSPPRVRVRVRVRERERVRVRVRERLHLSSDQRDIV